MQLGIQRNWLPTFPLSLTNYCEHIISRLSMIFISGERSPEQYWRFDNLCGSNNKQLIVLSRTTLTRGGWSYSTYLWNDSWVQTFHSFIVNIIMKTLYVPPSSRFSVSVSAIIIGPLERICFLVLSSRFISSSIASRLFLLLLLKQPLLHL